jgi:hypothetical protein
MAKNEQALRKLREAATADGDTFLFFKTTRLLGESEPPSNELTRCSEIAESKGKLRYALKGFEKLGLTDKVESIRARIANDGDILAEAEQTVFIPENEDFEGDEEEEDEG